MRLARADRRRRVLLLSTDPAHSLGDVFRAPAGDTAAAMPGAPPNLAVRELDAARALTARRAPFEAAFDEIASAIGIEGARCADQRVPADRPRAPVSTSCSASSPSLTPAQPTTSSS